MGGIVEPPQFLVDPELFRQAMRRWASGVTVVTSRFGEVQHGMTVSSFTSVSLAPPLVLVSIEQSTRTHEMIEQSGIYGVTILDHTQQEVSDCFAGRHTEHEDRFLHIRTFTLVTGAPLLEKGLASFDCRVVSAYPAGSHTLFIAEVLAASIGPGDAPLIYYHRAYRRLEDLE